MKYTLLTVEPDGQSTSLPSPPSPAPLSPSTWPAYFSRFPSRFPCVIAFVTIMTLAIFGFRCLAFVNVNPAPCYDDLKLPYVVAGNDSVSTLPPLKRRLPDAVIIGVRKCGTRALLTFLNRHPSVRAAGKEIHYFDNNYYLGEEWYRQQMPLAADDQIVIEKTPAYFIEPEAPVRVKDTLGMNVKLILIVRDPVERAVSDYVQLKIKYERTKTPSRRNVGNVLDEEERAPPQLPPRMPPFERKVLTHDGHINTSYKPIRIGQYDVHLKRWLEVFPQRQILVVDGENFVKDPFESLVQVEAFLGIQHWLSREHFVLNQDTGFYCLKADGHDETAKTQGISEQGEKTFE